jgi:hypothetical protein
MKWGAYALFSDGSARKRTIWMLVVVVALACQREALASVTTHCWPAAAVPLIRGPDAGWILVVFVAVGVGYR